MPHDLRRTRKYRGSRYCGWGQVGQHRKSGSRGGKGFAGGHKHFWIQTVKYNPLRFRRIGFKPPSVFVKLPSTINIGELKEYLIKTIGEDSIKEANEIDLNELGINKVLGRGDIDIALKIKVGSISKSAKTKIEEAGGSLIE